MPETTLTKEEWIKRCAAHYVKVTEVNQEQADTMADACWDMDHDISPEDAAEEDINCWEHDA